MHLSLPYYMIYKGNEKQKKGKKNYTKLHKWEKLPLKTLLSENLANLGYL